MLRKLLAVAAFGLVGWFGTAYALALALPTDAAAALPAMLVGPLPIAGGIVAAIVGCFVVRRL